MEWYPPIVKVLLYIVLPTQQWHNDVEFRKSHNAVLFTAPKREKLQYFFTDSETDWALFFVPYSIAAVLRDVLLFLSAGFE